MRIVKLTAGLLMKEDTTIKRSTLETWDEGLSPSTRDRRGGHITAVKKKTSLKG